MKLLFTIDRKDYDESWAHSKRPSIRAVIFKVDKLAMVYSVRDGYYKFPGGAVWRRARTSGQRSYARCVRR